jgi:hypothetical protein
LNFIDKFSFLRNFHPFTCFSEKARDGQNRVEEEVKESKLWEKDFNISSGDKVINHFLSVPSAGITFPLLEVDENERRRNFFGLLCRWITIFPRGLKVKKK